MILLKTNRFQQFTVVINHRNGYKFHESGNYLGCARTEGYYKIAHHEKKSYLHQAIGTRQTDGAESGEQRAADADQAKKAIQQSREARSESRRWQNVFALSGEDYGDLLKFNQLKVPQQDRHMSNLIASFARLIKDSQEYVA